ncbi:MAG TPA: MFS transporter, partial [Thermoleophilaceae bacterium]|nr:MFS transporter [Thermoleophilaceae bacterium]
MRLAIDLFRHEPRARTYFAALAQSSLGTGAAYVALLLVAYERFESPWAIGLVLLADVLPASLFGPLFGAAADRWSRRGAIVLADVIRAAAFAGILLVDGFVPTLLLALVAGVGTGLFNPASLAALPSLVSAPRLPAATSVYGAVMDVGYIAGPALAAGVLALGGAETILALNAVTFSISAVLLARLAFGAAPGGTAAPARRASLLSEAREGMSATGRFQGLRLLLFASAVALFFGGFFNVAELLLAKEELGAGEVVYSILVATYGFGFIAGSLLGGKGGSLQLLKRRYLAGGALMGAGFVASGLAPSAAFALAAFLVGGLGNGLLLVHERLLIQALVPDELSGRVFGIKDSLTAWAFALAFLLGAGALAALGTREALVLAG